MKWSQKEALFKLPIQEKIERVTFLKNVSAKFFAAQKMDKANKIFQRIHAFFKSKDAKTNYCEENEDTTFYRDGKDAL